MSKNLRNFSQSEEEKIFSRIVFREGIFQDRRTKFVHRDEIQPDGLTTKRTHHILLFGKDLAEQRRRVFAKKHAPKWWDMHHKISGLVGRCDCQHNLQPLDPGKHRAEHNREIKSGKVDAEAQ